MRSPIKKGILGSLSVVGVWCFFQWQYGNAEDPQETKAKLSFQEHKKNFEKYATLQLPDGRLVMTTQDFVTSLLPPGLESRKLTKEEMTRLSACFALADSDNDGYISFPEYFSFCSLMSKEDALLRVTFRIFDKDGDGFITFKEFQSIIDDQQGKNQVLFTNEGVLHCATIDRFKHIFGEEGDKNLNYQEFLILLKKMNEVILEQEFKEREVEPGFITPSAFSQLVFNRFHKYQLPFYIHRILSAIHQDNELLYNHKKEAAIDAFHSPEEQEIIHEVEATRLVCEPKRSLPKSYRGKDIDRISLTEYLAFNSFVKAASDIEMAVELFTIAGGKVSREDFGPLTKKFTKLELSEGEIDFVFAIFDRSGKGVLDSRSLRYLYTNRHRSALVPERSKLSIMWTLILWSISSKISSFCTFPMDTVKTHIQLSPVGSGSLEMLQNIIRKVGIVGLFKGVNVLWLGIVFEKAIKLTAFDYIIQKLRDDPYDTAVWKDCLAGAVTGIGTSFVANSYEQVKIRIQMHPSQSGNAWLLMYRFGLRNGVYGLSTTMCRDVIFNVIYFPLFNYLKGELKASRHGISGTALFLAHTVAAMAAVCVSNPFDVIKTVYQDKSLGRWNNPWHCTHTIIRREGVEALFKGTLARTVAIVPLFALTFLAFEQLQRYLQPGTILGMKTWQEDFDLVRQHRFYSIQESLKEEYGLDVSKIRELSPSDYVVDE